MKVIIVVTTLCILLIACAQGTDITGKVVAEESIKIGVVNALTGASTDYGLPALHGMIIAKNELSAQGVPVELIVEDGACNPKKASIAARKLTNIDHVDILISGCSSETLAVAPIATQEKTVLIAAVSSSPTVSEAGQYVFRTSPSDRKGIQKFATYIYGLGHTRIAILSEISDYPQGLRKSFEPAFEALEGTITFSENYEEDRDYRTPLLKAVESKPDALLLLVQSTKTGVQLLNQIEELGITLPLFGDEIFGGNEVLEVAGDQTEGLIFLAPNLDTSREKTKEFLATYSTQYPGDRSPNLIYVTASYDAVHLAAESVRVCNRDTECVISYLNDIENFEGASGTISFDENGDPEYAHAINSILDGQVVRLE